MTTTILYDDRATDVSGAHVAQGHLWLSPAELTAATGWKLEEAGLCQGDACVRTQPEWIDAAGRIDLSAFAGWLDQPVLRETDGGDIWAFGPSASSRKSQLFSLEAPEFTLPDLDGRMHSLSDYRGRKVFMYSWGSY